MIYFCKQTKLIDPRACVFTFESQFVCEPAGVIWACSKRGRDFPPFFFFFYPHAPMAKRHLPCFIYDHLKAKSYLKALNTVNQHRVMAIWKDTAVDTSCTHAVCCTSCLQWLQPCYRYVEDFWSGYLFLWLCGTVSFHATQLYLPFEFFVEACVYLHLWSVCVS